jgi:hypothetical protein
MLEPTSDIGQLYHNTRVIIPQCSLEFLFARFAWSIFPSLSGFLSRPARSRLVVRVNADGKRFVEEVTNPLVLRKNATASRSNSPTKRSRMAADLEEDIECSKRVRLFKAESYESSFDSTLPSLEEDNIFERRPSYALNNSQSVILSNVSQAMDLYPLEKPMVPADTFESVGEFYIDELRQEALVQQRPVWYSPERPPYYRHRPAKEELEFMGVDIIGDLDEYSN